MTFFDRIRNTATGVPIPDVSQLPEVGRLLVALHSLLEKLAEVRHHITDGGGGGVSPPSCCHHQTQRQQQQHHYSRGGQEEEELSSETKINCGHHIYRRSSSIL